MKRIAFLLVAGFMIVNAYSQDFDKHLARKDERVIFSFQVVQNKKVLAIIETNTKAITCRFGRPGNIELEYPDENKTTGKLFTLKWYMRPGMQGMNEGMVQLRFEFINKGFYYIVYFDHYDDDNSSIMGIQIRNAEGKTIADLEGENAVGSLMTLVDDERLHTREMPGGE